MQLTGRTALVTGGGRRVGRALALALGRRGMRVAVHYNSSDAGARETTALIEKANGSAAVFAADLSDAAAPAALIGDVASHFGGLDVLVNSAAIMARMPFGDITTADWDRVLSLNLRAPFFLAQAAAPHLRRARGAMINIADLAAFETWPGYLPHGVSKSGIVYLTRALARVLAPDVRVNGIAPGTVLLPDDWSRDDEARLNETTPLQRAGSPDDVASTMLYLLDNDYITGETIIVDGGRHVRR